MNKRKTLVEGTSERIAAMREMIAHHDKCASDEFHDWVAEIDGYEDEQIEMFPLERTRLIDLEEFILMRDQVLAHKKYLSKIVASLTDCITEELKENAEVCRNPLRPEELSYVVVSPGRKPRKIQLITKNRFQIFLYKPPEDD